MRPSFWVPQVLLALIALWPLSFPAVASAQTSVIALPFVSSIAGMPVGSTNTMCTPVFPQATIQPTPPYPWTSASGLQYTNQVGAFVGDGCAPTQANLNGLQDTKLDAEGNIYISEGSARVNEDIRVIYKGGTTLTNMLIAANAGQTNFMPVPGNIYTLAGGLKAAITASHGIYYCGGILNGQQGLNTEGDGCPAAEAYLQPLGMAIDAYGDIYVINIASSSNLRVIYAGGAPVAKLLKVLYPTITPQIGYIYQITGGSSSTGYGGDGELASSNNVQFGAARYVAIDNANNIYVSDGAPTSTNTNGMSVIVTPDNVRRIDATTGIITTYAGENFCLYAKAPVNFCNPAGATINTFNGGYNGDGGPAVSSTVAGIFNAPYVIFFDAFNNLYIADQVNARLRVVYQGGTIPGIANPQPGYIYTYAGGGTSTVNGTLNTSVKFSAVSAAGIDPAGNIYVEDSGPSHVLWRFDAGTGVGNIIAGGKSSSSVSQTGVLCAGAGSAAGGLVSLDNYGDGCIATQAALLGVGSIVFDAAGHMYSTDTSDTSANTNMFVREFNFDNQFPPTPDGTAVTQLMAFESTTTATTPTPSFSLEGQATAEFSAAANPICTSPSGTSKLCIYNVSFQPAHPGQRGATASIASAHFSENLSGIGVGADLAIDTGTKSALGTGLAPTGVATDLLGNVYVADTTGNRVLAGPSSGSTLTPVITGLNKPAGVSVDGAGNIYVADTGNNRILETTSAGTVIASLGTGLSAPQGVAVNGLGGIFVADTGNNRIVHLAADGYQTSVPIFGLSAPTQLALDSSGDLFVVDSGNGRLLEYANGQTSTVVIDAGVTPSGVAVDDSGTVYVADSANLRVLSYPPGATFGNVLLTGLTAPVGLASDPDGNLFIADKLSTSVIGLLRSLGSFTFPLTAFNLGQTTTEGIVVNNVGNAPLVFPSAPLTTVTSTSTDYSVAPSTTDGCGLNSPYAPGTSCNFTASYEPTTAGSTTATVKFNTNAVNTATVSAVLNGNALNLVKTTTALTITAPTGSVSFGQTVSVTAQLTASNVTTTPTGTFSFSVDGKTPVSVTIGSGSYTLQVPSLTVGPHTISVAYSGDTTYDSSAATVAFTVALAPTTTTVSVAPLNVSGAISLQFTATVVAPTAPGLTGTVNFYAGTQLLNATPVPLNSSGVATISVAALSFATNSFTAVYSGAANFATSTSAVDVPPGDFVLGSVAAALSIPQGGIASGTYQVASLYNSSGTLSLSCTGLPANSACRFSPVTVTLASGAAAQSVFLQIYTDTPSTLALNTAPDRSRLTVLACGLSFGCVALLLLRRRRMLFCLAVVVYGTTCFLGLSGCGSGTASSTSVPLTPAGVYNINVVFTGSNGISTTHSAPVVLTIVTNTGPYSL